MLAPNQWHWITLARASATASAAALAFYPALRLGHRSRTSAWLACSAAVGLSPCLVPLSATPLRFIASLFAITLLVKLHDLHRAARLGLHLSLWSYLAYLPNGFWLVLRRAPSRPPRISDLRSLGCRAPAAVLAVLLCGIAYRVNWSSVPFPLEHVLKVAVVTSSVVLMTNAVAASYRLVGGVAIDFMRNPLAAPTPADFWRRWN